MDALPGRAHRGRSRCPLMIDSTDADGASSWRSRYCQGKAIINSINLEDGEERFEQVVPLRAAATARRWSSGCIDEDKQQGMAVTRERKLAIAERSLHAADREVRRRRPRTSSSTRSSSPCGTGDAELRRHARSRRSRASARSRRRFPERKTILGISNVSFGLPDGGPRGAELGLPLPLRRRPGSTSRSSTRRSSSATPSIPEEERAARRGPDLQPRRRIRSRPSPRTSAAKKARAEADGVDAAARRAPRRATSSRASKDGPDRRPRGRSCEEAGAARHHQRPADEGHGRGRPALQRQRADRRRGAPVAPRR